MEKFSINFNELDTSLTKKKAYRLKDIDPSRVEKVAFDIVRFVNTDNIDGLWQVQKCDDGDYIVATYEGDDPQNQTKSSSNWAVQSDQKGEKLSVYYKDTPVTKISLADLGIESDDANQVCEYLPTKLASNSRLRDGLIADLTDEERKVLFKVHPELSI